MNAKGEEDKKKIPPTLPGDKTKNKNYEQTFAQ